MTARRTTIRSLQVRPVDVPLDPPIRASAGTVSSAPLVLIDLLTEDGITGSAISSPTRSWRWGRLQQLFQTWNR